MIDPMKLAKPKPYPILKDNMLEERVKKLEESVKRLQELPIGWADLPNPNTYFCSSTCPHTHPDGRSAWAMTTFTQGGKVTCELCGEEK